MITYSSLEVCIVREKTNIRVSNLKYVSVRIDSKTVVFVRPNPGKKETTD